MAVAVEPLNYATGYVAAVDMTKGTVTINGKVFAAKPADLYDVQPGTEIEIWFDKNAQAAAVAVKPAAEIAVATARAFLGPIDDITFTAFSEDDFQRYRALLVA